MNRRSLLVAGSYNVGMTVVAPDLPRPGETVKGTAFDLGPGGKGANQAIAARRLGADVDFLVMLGTDRFGEDARATLTQEGLPPALLLRTDQASTGAALISVDAHGRNQISIAPGANALLRGNHAPDEIVSSAQVLLCQLECPVEVFTTLAPAVRAGGGTTVLNPAPAQQLDADILALCDYLIPNEIELASLTALPTNSDEQVLVAALQLVERGATNVIVTLGERGAVLANREQARHFPSPAVTAMDTTGAGDAFCAGLATALWAGWSVDSAIAHAARAGAFCVTRRGVIDGLGRPDDLEALPDPGRSTELAIPALDG